MQSGGDITVERRLNYCTMTRQQAVKSLLLLLLQRV